MVFKLFPSLSIHFSSDEPRSSERIRITMFWLPDTKPPFFENATSRIYFQSVIQFSLVRAILSVWCFVDGFPYFCPFRFVCSVSSFQFMFPACSSLISRRRRCIKSEWNSECCCIVRQWQSQQINRTENWPYKSLCTVVILVESVGRHCFCIAKINKQSTSVNCDWLIE